MIRPVTMYGVECDVIMCPTMLEAEGSRAWEDPADAITWAKELGWYVKDDPPRERGLAEPAAFPWPRHLCPDHRAARDAH